MPIKTIKTAFNAGELSEYLSAREDINKYHNGCSKLINALVLPHGGFTKRPGTIYKATSASRANLTPFEFSVGDALILEWSNVLLRFYKDQAIVNKGVGTEDISALDNIIAHWLLNDEIGTNVVDDDGATHDGTATVDIATLTTAGKVNNCFDLDGQYTVEISDHNDFSFTNNLNDSAFSIVCWGFVTQQGGLQALVSKWRDINSTREWRFSITNDRKLQLHLADGSTSLGTDRVAQWFLNDDAASTAVDDNVASVPHDGIASSNTDTFNATGKINGALDFGGVEYVTVADHAALSFDDSGSNPFSISAWAYIETGTTQMILSKWDQTTGSEDMEWVFYLTDGDKLTLQFQDISAGATITCRADNAISSGWHHVVCTYDSAGGATAANGMKLYIDSTEVTVTRTNNANYVAMEAGATAVLIGASTVPGGTIGNIFKDKLDNVILFDKELSQADVNVLYNSGNGIEALTGQEVFTISDSPISTGWHLFACTYSAPADETAAADGIILYVDGAVVDSTATNNASYIAMQNGAEEVRIGSQRNSDDNANENFWEDKIDEVSIFGDVLTPTEVASLYSTTPYSIISPYTTAQAFQIHYTQSADVMYIAHPDIHPKKLSRNDTLDWTLVSVPFKGGPFLAENTTTASLVGFAREGGTARDEYYFPADATGTLTASGSGNEPFNSNMVGALWLVKHTRDNDNDTDTFAKDTNVVPTLTTFASGAIFIKGDATVTFEPIATGKMAQLWRKTSNGNWQTYRSFRGATAFSWTENEDDILYAMTRSDNSINGTLTAKEAVNYGIVKITGFTSATVVTVTVVDKVLSNNSNDNAVTTSMWAEGAWSDYRGYPRTVGFHEDRLWWASSTNNPDRLWSSRSGLYEDMSFSDLGADDEAVTPEIRDNEVSQVQWMMSRKVMAIGAANREYSFAAQNPDDPISPTDKKSTPQTGFSSGAIQPVMLNDSIFFLQRQGKKLGAMKFDAITENFDVDDATLLAYGLLDSAPTNMAVSRSPDSTIWIVRTDGVMPTFTYEPKEEVSGWARQIFGNSAVVETVTGFVESTAVIHGTSEDEIWVNVRRVINSSTVYYTELFAPRDWGTDIEDAKFIDSLVTYDSTLTATVTAAHLKGETLSVFADGEVFDDAIANASTGVITLKKDGAATSASVVQYGLPYTMKVRTMRASIPQEGNTIQTRIKRVHSVVIRFVKSLLGSAGQEYGGVEHLTPIGATFDNEAKDTGEDNRSIEGGNSEEAYITIVSDDPVPFTCLAAIISYEVEERR